MCIYVGDMYTCLQRYGEGIGSLEVVVIGGCELPNRSFSKGTVILCESSTHF